MDQNADSCNESPHHHADPLPATEVLDGRSHQLRCSNLGDSGFLVLRPTAADHRVMDVVFRSSQQLHYFNCPAQARTPHRRRAEL